MLARSHARTLAHTHKYACAASRSTPPRRTTTATDRRRPPRKTSSRAFALAAWLGERERHGKARQAEDERLAGTPLHTARAIDLQLVKSKVDLRGGTAIVDQKRQWNQILFELVCIRDSHEWVYSPRARMYNRCMCRQT